MDWLDNRIERSCNHSYHWIWGYITLVTWAWGWLWCTYHGTGVCQYFLSLFFNVKTKFLSFVFRFMIQHRDKHSKFEMLLENMVNSMSNERINMIITLLNFGVDINGKVRCFVVVNCFYFFSLTTYILLQFTISNSIHWNYMMMCPVADRHCHMLLKSNNLICFICSVIMELIYM